MRFHDSLRLVLGDGMTGAPLKPDGSNEVVLMPQIPEGIVRVWEQLEKVSEVQARQTR
jgi:hypothetical protein